jgi:hypothetical protein
LAQLAGVPLQVPGVVHPAQLQLVPVAQVEQELNVGVPVQVFPVLKSCGGDGTLEGVVAQQIRLAPEQSSSLLHDLGQLV